MRDGVRRLRAGLWIAVAVGVVASFSPRVVVPALPGSAAPATRSHSTRAAPLAASTARRYAAVLSDVGKAPRSAQARGRASHGGALQSGQTEAVAEQQAGVFVPASSGSATSAVPAVRLPARKAGPPVAPLRTAASSGPARDRSADAAG